ncbi:MAG TPA: hypothetical protein VHA56_22010 [Mucilaginibacter sp.]|nr:hypothetical protein [Mucilaginibacter sp.]
MRKIFFLWLLITLAGLSAKGQAIDSTYSKYLDFNLARFQGEEAKALTLGESLLPDAGKLSEKAKISFYFSIGKIYDDSGQPEKALLYYNKVAAAVPDYYVVHRGIGYIYLAKADDIRTRYNAATDAATKTKLLADYEKAVRQALPHLEKAQACDPSDETLDAIKTLYKNINDTKALSSLTVRLKTLSAHCIDLLEDN